MADKRRGEKRMKKIQNQRTEKHTEKMSASRRTEKMQIQKLGFLYHLCPKKFWLSLETQVGGYSF